MKGIHMYVSVIICSCMFVVIYQLVVTFELIIRGDKVSMLTRIYPHRTLRKIK